MKNKNMKRMLFKFLKAGVFIPVVLVVTFLIFRTYEFKPITAAPASIDCSVGSPRDIAQGVDFNGGDDLTLYGNGTCVWTDTSIITLNSLIVGSVGGDTTVLTHQDNSTTQQYSIDINSTVDITIYSGASIDVDGLGYDGGTVSGHKDGYGPAGGTEDSGGSGSHGSGGGHGGDGGDDDETGASYDAGGTANCDITNPATIGSGGGTGYNGGRDGGDGGGLVILNASGTVDIDGTITADGNWYDDYAGGGGGGGIKISANIIDLDAAANITATGTNATLGGGGGGGGCILLEYITSNNITYSDVSMNGGTGASGAENGGAGQLLIHDTDSGDDGDLYLINGGTYGASSTQEISSLTVDSITLDDEAGYTVPNGNSLTLNDASPLLEGGGSETLEVAGSLTYTTGNNYDNFNISVLSGGTLYNTATINITNDGGLTLNSGSTVNTTITTLTTANTLNLEYGATFTIVTLDIDGGTTTLNSYDTSNALSITTLDMDGGTLTHGDNSTTQTNIINISATTVDIGAAASIDVDGLGYDGGRLGHVDGYGDGPGVFATAQRGSGAGHGGDGGADFEGDAGGTAYCIIANPATMGSGGGTGYNGTWDGGDGGGLIILNASGIVTVDGTITADGAKTSETSYGGGGAGGAVKITADIISGTLTGGFTVAGGDGGNSGGGAGGGGCILLEYTTSNSIAAGDVSVVGGIADGAGSSENGAIGLFSSVQLNSAPTVSINSAASKTDGTGTVDISIELDDNDLADTLSTKLEYKAGADCSAGTSDPTIDDTIGTYSADSGTPTINNAVEYQVSNLPVVDVGSNTIQFDWSSQTNVPAADGTYCVRVTPYDGTDTGTPADTTFTLDNINPTASGNLTNNTITTTSITHNLGAAGSDTNMDQYLIYYKQAAAGVTESDILHATIASGAYTPGNTTTINTLSINTQYVANIWTYDSYGNEANATEIAIYTTANTPGTSTVNNPATSTVDVSFDINSNPASTEFAIQETGSGNYVQANGSLGAIASWQNNAAWGTTTVTGLSLNTTYTFQTKARNGDNVETSFGGTNSLYTLAEVPGQPTISNLTTNSFNITLGNDSNPAYTTYAIQVSDGTDFYYVQADGTLGASEVWQTKALWGTTAVTGLSAGTSYVAHAKARNEDGIETAFDGTDSGTTGEEEDTDEDGDEDEDVPTDTIPPTITNLSPEKGAVKISPDITISFHAKDIGSGVDIGTLRTTIVGSKSGRHRDSEVLKAFSGSASDFEVTLIPERDFAINEQVRLEVRVRDYANNQTILTDHIFLIRPAEEPTADNLTEERGEDGESLDVYRAKTSKTEEDIRLEEEQGIIDNGANIEVADLTYDGTKEIVTAPRFGAPFIRIYSKEGFILIPPFLAYDESYTGGVNIAVGDLHGTGGEQEIITSPMDGAAHIRIFNKDGDPLNSFFAREQSFRGNSLVKVANLEGPDQDSGDLEIIILFSDGILKVFNKEGEEIMPNAKTFLPYLQTGEEILFDLDVVDIENNQV